MGILMFENLYLLSLCPITNDRFNKRERTVTIALKKCNYITFSVKNIFQYANIYLYYFNT